MSDPALTLRGLQERLDFFIEHGLRPFIKTHTLRQSDSSYGDMLEESWGVLASGDLYGWEVGAHAIDHSQGVWGGTYQTLEQALVDAENELDKLISIRANPASNE